MLHPFSFLWAHETSVRARLERLARDERSESRAAKSGHPMLEKKHLLAPQARAQLLPARPVLVCWDAVQRSAPKEIEDRAFISRPLLRKGTGHPLAS
jgi:hypothetical protein